MNHGHQFDIALSAERKAEQERKQAKREARKKLEAAAPDLLAACELVEEAWCGRCDNGNEMATAVDACLLAIKKAK